MKHHLLGEDCRTGFGRMKHKVNKGEVLSMELSNCASSPWKGVERLLLV